MLWAFVLTSVAGFMVTLDNLVVTTALPVIRHDLGAGLGGLEWTVNAYTLTFAVLLLTGAALGDRFGRRRLLAIGLAIFTVSSARPRSRRRSRALDAARALQGLGGAIVMPLTLTILSAAVPAERRGLALGAWGGITGLAVAFGPLVGGAVVSGISWHWIFWLNVPIGLVLIPLVAAPARREPRRLGSPRPAGPRARGSGCSGSCGASSAATRSAGARRRSSARSLGGVAPRARSSSGSCVRRRRCCRCASSATGRSRSRTPRRSSSRSGCSARSSCSPSSSRPCRATRRFGSGLRILPWTAMPMIVAPIAGALSDRIGGQRLMGAGLRCRRIGLAWIAAVSTPTTPYIDIVAPFTISGAGMALFFAPVANVVLSWVRPSEQGQASGANNAIRELGGVLGVAVLASIFAALRRLRAGDRRSPTGWCRPCTIGAAWWSSVGSVAAFADRAAARSAGRSRRLRSPRPRARGVPNATWPLRRRVRTARMAMGGGSNAGERTRLLVLGAGPAQLGLLEAARAHGIWTAVCDRDPGARRASRSPTGAASSRPTTSPRSSGSPRRSPLGGLIAPGTDTAGRRSRPGSPRSSAWRTRSPPATAIAGDEQAPAARGARCRRGAAAALAARRTRTATSELQPPVVVKAADRSAAPALCARPARRASSSGARRRPAGLARRRRARRGARRRARGDRDRLLGRRDLRSARRHRPRHARRGGLRRPARAALALDRTRRAAVEVARRAVAALGIDDGPVRRPGSGSAGAGPR